MKGLNEIKHIPAAYVTTLLRDILSIYTFCSEWKQVFNFIYAHNYLKLIYVLIVTETKKAQSANNHTVQQTIILFSIFVFAKILASLL